MCSIEGAEPWDVFSSEMRRAAKGHECCECHRGIAKGERYEIAKGMIDKHWHTYRTCEHCIAARSWLLVECDGYLFEGVLEELAEHWHEGYKSIPLGRFMCSMVRRWRKRDGTMMPVPAHIESQEQIADSGDLYNRISVRLTA